MTFTYSLSTNVGKVRLLIRDTVEASQLLSDEEIQAFLDMFGSDIKLSAANALRSIASSKALTAKAKSAGKYSEDTRQIYKALMELADTIENSAVLPYDTVAEQTFGPSAENEFIDKENLRNAADA